MESCATLAATTPLLDTIKSKACMQRADKMQMSSGPSVDNNCRKASWALCSQVFENSKGWHGLSQWVRSTGSPRNLIWDLRPCEKHGWPQAKEIEMAKQLTALRDDSMMKRTVSANTAQRCQSGNSTSKGLGAGCPRPRLAKSPVLPQVFGRRNFLAPHNPRMTCNTACLESRATRWPDARCTSCTQDAEFQPNTK